jgi:hypothetical protein
MRENSALCNKENSHPALSYVGVDIKINLVTYCHAGVGHQHRKDQDLNLDHKRRDMKKSHLISTGLAVALTVGTVGITHAAPSQVAKKASAAARATNAAATTSQSNPMDTILKALVANGTITQAQATAITSALGAARAAMPRPSVAGGTDESSEEYATGPGSRGRGAHGPDAASQATILSTLGITAAQLEEARVAGKSLATLAGTKTQALIGALVAQKTADINAKVTAKTITQAQATAMIAGLTAKVTEMVNANPGQKPARGGHGRRGGGAGTTGGFTAAPGAPSVGGSN